MSLPKEKLFSVCKFKAKKILEVRNYSNNKIKYLNLEFKKKRHFKNDNGPGIYTLEFEDKLIYIGSYKGNDGVVKERWWTHIASMTSRFRKINFHGSVKKGTKVIKFDVRNFNLGDKKMSFNKILDFKESKPKIKDFIDRQLTIKKQIIKERFKDLKKYKSFYKNIISNVLKINSNDDKEIIQILAYDSCLTTLKRTIVAATHWHKFKHRTKDNILDNFVFTYYKFNKYPFPFKTKKEKYSLTKHFENPLIVKFKPKANDIPSQKDDDGLKLNDRKTIKKYNQKLIKLIKS